jgi:hypothetical protein
METLYFRALALSKFPEANLKSYSTLYIILSKDAVITYFRVN